MLCAFLFHTSDSTIRRQWNGNTVLLVDGCDDELAQETAGHPFAVVVNQHICVMPTNAGLLNFRTVHQNGQDRLVLAVVLPRRLQRTDALPSVADLLPFGITTLKLPSPSTM